MAAVPPLSDAVIKEFLESAPIYSWKEFAMPQVNRSGIDIDAVDSVCTTCKQERPFHNVEHSRLRNMRLDALATGVSHLAFECVSCRSEKRLYFVEHVVKGRLIQMQKFGELPRQRLVRNKHLQKFLEDDLDNFEKGIVCIATGYGIGAFAYWRRIVEDNVDRLLGLILDDATASGVPSQASDAIAQLRGNERMSKKIDIANTALPDYLKPNGANPLGRLYGLLSDGVHNLSEQECLEKAQNARACLEYLVGELSSRKASRQQFVSMIGKL